MTSPASIGHVLRISAHGYSAEITTVGAHLRSLTYHGRDLIVPFGDELPWGAHGAVLTPWPNRIEDGTYSWEGQKHSLPISEPERNNAIHGLVMTQEWQAQSTDSGARLNTAIRPTQGYPFTVALTLEYRLEPHGLEVVFTATNQGENTAPFGVGFHPWLAAGPGGLEQASLQFEAEQWLEADSRLLPTTSHPIPDRFNFHEPRIIGDETFDDAFLEPAYDLDGRSWVHLTGSDGYRVSAWMSQPLRVWQLCSDPGEAPRPGIAAEPMSCAANAFNTTDLLQSLRPGTPFTATWGIRAEQEVKS